MATRRPRLQRGLIIGAACAIFAVNCDDAHAATDIELPLSSAMELLVPPGSFVEYSGTVNSSEFVRLPHYGSNSERLVKLLSAYGLQDSVSGYTYTVFPIGSPPVPPTNATATLPMPTSYASPGFSMALPPPPPPKPVYIAPIVAVPAKSTAVAGFSTQNASPLGIPAAPHIVAPPPPPPVWSLPAGTLISRDIGNSDEVGHAFQNEAGH